MSRHMRTPLDLTFDCGEGFWSEGDWVEGGNDTRRIFCSIQTYREGTVHIVSPKGFTSNGALTIFSKSAIKTVFVFIFSGKSTRQVIS